MRATTVFTGLTVFVLGAASLLCVSQSTPAVEPVSHAAHRLQVGAGDLLEVSVFDSPELSSKLRVNDKGEIALPIGGTIQVQGMTSDMVSNAVEKQLRDADIVRDPHVAVFVLEYATQGATVGGEVKNPGIYPLLGSHNLVDMIAAAGGATQMTGKAVTITHKSDPTHPEVVTVETKPGSAVSTIDVLPGDTIVVSKAGIVYVLGDVGRAGGYLIENNDKLTALQAISLAQGANRTASANNTKIIRNVAGVREEIELPLKKILQNRAPDLPVQDGDIIFVPSSAGRLWVQRSMEAAIQATAGLIVYGRR